MTKENKEPTTTDAQKSKPLGKLETTESGDPVVIAQDYSAPPTAEMQQIMAATPAGCGYFTIGSDKYSPDYVAAFCDLQSAEKQQEELWTIKVGDTKLSGFTLKHGYLSAKK